MTFGEGSCCKAVKLLRAPRRLVDEMRLNDSEGSVPGLACRGLGMQRSVKSQALTLHPGPIVLHSPSTAKPPQSQGRPVVGVARLWLLPDPPVISAAFHLLFLFLSLLFSFPLFAVDFHRIISLLPFFCKACVSPSCQCAELYTQLGSGEAVFSLSAHPTLPQTPSWLQSHHIRPCLTAAKQEAGTLDSLSYYLGHRPAMP